MLQKKSVPRLFFIALRILPFLIAGFNAHAAGDGNKGKLFEAKVDGHEVIACVADNEGRFYTVAPQNKGERFFTQQTRLMVRPDASHAGDALLGIWQVALKGSCCNHLLYEPQYLDKPIFEWMELKTDGEKHWVGILHYGLYSDRGDLKDWVATPITFTQAADNCSAFEDKRLKLAWRLDENADNNARSLIRRFRHPVTQVSRDELLPSRFPQAQVKRINEQLAKLAAGMNEEWSRCQDYDDASLSLIGYSKRLVIFEGGSSNYCGGVHPNEDQNLFTFDLQTGKQIELWKWFVGDGNNIQTGKQTKLKELFFYNGNNIMSDGLWKLLLRKINSDDTDDDCVERMKERRSFFEPFFSSKGVKFRFFEAGRPFIMCRSDTVLPFKAVRPFIKPERRKDFDAFARGLVDVQPPQ